MDKRKIKVVGFSVVLIISIFQKQFGTPFLGDYPDIVKENAKWKGLNSSQHSVYRHFNDYQTNWKRNLWRFPRVSEFLVEVAVSNDSKGMYSEAIYHFLVGEIKYDEQSNETVFIAHAQKEKIEKVGKQSTNRPPLPRSDKAEVASGYPIRLLSNGDSPYDRYFGSGRYSDTQNSVLVKASSNSDVVFILIDVYSGRKIRNEFIRRGTTFNLTKIPYGTYDYMYYSGSDWSDDFPVNQTIKGGFTRNTSFTKNSYSTDRIEFEQGYYGSYEITLYEVSGGNLETTSTTSAEFFN